MRFRRRETPAKSGNVLVEVDATVGKLAERSLPLKLCKVFRQPKFHHMYRLHILQRGDMIETVRCDCSLSRKVFALNVDGDVFVGWVCIPAASSAFCVNVSNQRFGMKSIENSRIRNQPCLRSVEVARQ
jgi:hypothetical protein